MSRVLPAFLVLNVVLFFGPVAIYGGGFAIIAIGLCLLAGCAFPALTFVYAAGKHAEFKERFGVDYMKLVAEGTIPLSVSAVLSGLSPAAYEHLFRSANKKSVQSPPL